MSAAAERVRDLVIVGAGGHAREMLALVDDLNTERARWKVRGFVDDRAALVGTTVASLPVLGTTHELAEGRFGREYVLGIGSPVAKRRLAERLDRAGLGAPTLVHPTVVRGPRVALGRGALVAAGAVLTCDVAVGDFVTVNVGCTLSHDVTVEDFATLAPRVSLTGAVRVGSGADVGVGVVTVQGVRIGEWSVIGAGAVVTAHLPADCTAVGVPARPIKQRPAGWHLT